MHHPRLHLSCLILQDQNFRPSFLILLISTVFLRVRALVASIRCPGILDSEAFGSGVACTGQFPEGSLPCNPGSSDAAGLEAGALPLACSSPPRQSILCPSSVLPAVSTASVIIPAPSVDLQFCPDSQHGAPVIPRSSPTTALSPGVDACNHGVTWSSVVQQNTPGDENALIPDETE